MRKKDLDLIIRECIRTIIKQKVLDEEGGEGGQGGAGQPGTGIGNVTANIDSIQTPKAFSKRKLKETEEPEPYDSETDTFAPGPRQRPEDWERGGAQPPEKDKVNEVKFNIIKLKDILRKKKL